MSGGPLSVLGPGDRIGPYQVRRRIGSGGMGTVFLCEAAESCPVPMGRPVAVKVLRTGHDDEDRRRFEREARYLQSLQHPGIIRLLDSGDHQGHPYLVMPFVAGKPVDDLVKEGRGIDERTAAGIAAQALEALHVAHLAGILHRDLKPGNLMVDDEGRVKVLDFGLAAGPMGESRLTATGDVLGTPVYMSPEQASGMRDHLSPRTDVYSIGACLYELLTGRAPVEADNSMAVLRCIIEDPLVPPSRHRPGLSRDLETVVLVAMAKDPRDRYRTAEEMAADLRRFIAGRRVKARRPGPFKALWRQLVRHRRTAALLGLVAFLAVVTLGIAARRLVQAQGAIPDPHEWVEERRYAGIDLVFTPCQPLGPQSEIATLPQVSGAVRLSAVLTIAAGAPPGTAAELLVSDPDIGRGYRLRLDLGAATGEAGGDRLLLLRQDRLMASRDVGALPRGRRLRLRLEHADVDLLAAVHEDGPGTSPAAQLRFLDLTPVQGPSASGAYLVRHGGAVEVVDVVVERHRGGEFVSALALADDRRLEGNFARAAALYQEFLRLHPDSPQARDARLRLAVCQAALPNSLEQAYASFTAAARDPKADPAYVMVATFHAWSSALRLSRYEDAERLFDAIRNAYDLPTLAAAVPEQTLRQVRDDYFTRAAKLEIEDPERAVRLYLSSAEIAGFIDNQQRGLGLANAGDLLMGLGRFEVALETYRRLADDRRLPPEVRRKGALKVGEALRMLGDLAGAEASYQRVLDDPAAETLELRWARLWLGDLCCQMARPDRAAELWREGADDDGGLPGRIMRHLVRLDGQIPAVTDPFFANDVDYFNGRIAWILGDLTAARDWFQRVASGARQHDWPAPLARAIIEGRAAGLPAP